MVEVTIRSKNVFVCFLNGLHRRIGETQTTILLFQRCIHFLTKHVKDEICTESGATKPTSEQIKKQLEYKVKVVGLMSLIDQYSYYLVGGHKSKT